MNATWYCKYAPRVFAVPEKYEGVARVLIPQTAKSGRVFLYDPAERLGLEMLGEIQFPFCISATIVAKIRVFSFYSVYKLYLSTGK